MFIKEPVAKSSFLSIEKDMRLISNIMLKNRRLKNLLYYTTPDCLDKPEVPEEEAYAMFGKNIRMVPKLDVNESILNYIFIKFSDFTPNATNTEFRDNVIEFDIVCHLDQWQMKDFQLRPYRIAAELDSMFDKQRLTGIGTLNFLGADPIMLSDEFAGLCLMYSAIHGEEDKTPMINPKDQEQFEKDFKAMLQ